MGLTQILLPLFFLISTQVESEAPDKIITTWPESGPRLELEINGIGNGYSEPVVTEDRIFVTGEVDSVGYVYAFDFDGNTIWKKDYGPEWMVSYPGSRGAPNLVDTLLYVCSGNGRLVCFSSISGEEIWAVDLIRDFEGKNVTYGFAMKPVASGEKLFCSPGGDRQNVIALNRFTGELIWSSPGFGDTAGYGSPLIIDLPFRKVLVTSSEYNIFSLDASTGELLWSYELAFKGDIPCNTPVYDGTHLYWVAGPGNGGVAARLSDDGSNMEVAWKNMDFDTSFGGFVQVGDYLYGSSNSLHRFVSLDTGTGKIQHTLPFGIGSIAIAGNMLIAYNQAGKVGLLEPDGEKLELISSFRISKGTREHFAHALVAQDRLFIRHGNTMQVFALKDK